MTETLSRLLIVDDDPDIPAVVKRFALKLGFQVTSSDDLLLGNPDLS